MRHPDFQHLECPMARALDVIGEWWTLLIVRDLFYGVRTFDALQRDLGIARNILSARLKKLEEHGVIEKSIYRDHPPRSHYKLTPKGKDLFPVIVHLVEWGNRWESDKGPIVELTHGADGHAVDPLLSCASCGQSIDLRTVSVRVGSGATRPLALPVSLRPPDESSTEKKT